MSPPFASRQILLVLVALAAALLADQHISCATVRSSESLAALLASGRRQIPSGPTQVSGDQQQQQQVAAQPRESTGASAVIQPLLSALQSQAQRQMNQLNGLVMANAPNLTATATSSGQQVGNVLEVLSNVGKAIQQQIIAGSPSNRFVSIVTSSQNGNTEQATNKKNEYQSIVANEGQPLQVNEQGDLQAASASSNVTAASSLNHREQSEMLRQEIVRRASQLQQVVASSMEILKNNGDLIVRRLLEQLNSRLDQAKSKADKIINEPATTDVAIKALHTINSGLNNLNNIITNIVNRLDLNSKDGLSNQLQQFPAMTNLSGATQRVASNANALIEAARSRLNLHQLGQQFSSALNAVQQQQQQQQQQQRQQQAAVLAQQHQPQQLQFSPLGDNKKIAQSV